jgi:FAD/FMN-containing dehydrogenase
MRFLTLTSISLLASAVSAYSESCDACEQLSSALPNNTFYPTAPTYNASIQSYPFLQLRLHPSCIVRPSTSQDVSTAVSILAQTNCTKFAIKGGGHNANAGSNNIDDGVTIDMQSLKKVEVAKGDKVVRVGAGALWQDVYDTAEKRNRTVMGGRIGVVGTAGFLTGGKYKCPIRNIIWPHINSLRQEVSHS